jgi:hypothetical protein
MTLRASRLIGAAVVDRQGRQLGRVSDLLLENPGPAKPCYALVDLGPPSHARERTVAVPWSVLEPDEERGALVLEVSPDALGRLRSVGRAGHEHPAAGGKTFRAGGKFFR